MASNWQADFERGVQLMQTQQYGEAKELLEQALAAEPGQALIAYSLAVACAQTANAPRAIELLQNLEKSGNLTPAGRNLLDDLLQKSGAAPAAPQSGLKLNFSNTRTEPPANSQNGLQLNFGAPAPAAANVQAINIGDNPAQMLKMLRSMEKTGELTETGRQMMNNILAQHPELAEPVTTGENPGLRLNFDAPAAPAAAAPDGGLKLNFGAPAQNPGGPALNFSQPAAMRPALANRFGPGTVIRVANSAKTWKEILKFHGEICKNPEMDKFYRDNTRAFGDCWYYADVFTATFAAVKCTQPQNYLDLGSGEGRNLAAALHACKSLNFIVCENWDEKGLNAARDFALSLKGTGKGKFMQGTPATMLPKMFQANPELRFDVITIDRQNANDAEGLLRLALPALNLGGVLVLGGINCDPRLTPVWRNTLGSIGGFAAVEYCEAGAGVAVAVKVA